MIDKNPLVVWDDDSRWTATQVAPTVFYVEHCIGSDENRHDAQWELVRGAYGQDRFTARWELVHGTEHPGTELHPRVLAHFWHRVGIPEFLSV